ncbi:MULTISPECIES: ABC transporter ATP-binding protein [Terrabacteria group]|uniref:ABC transporter ATP-binding protein n=1 Tax=Bacillati TaxID=1783272 RepID=UPI001C6F3576|nr:MULTISPECIES: ABC transporter ATP-binding protein [Terrabacteria group]MBW9211956.1 ABC transporter ATP-binding protein/permease [Trueperella sp. zg.1013]
MISIIRKFFAFSDEKNRKKFHTSILLSVLVAFFESFKIGAISLSLQGIVQNTIDMTLILKVVLILVVGTIGAILVRAKSTVLQTQGGYGVACDKRIEIAEHLRYFPMGFFNKKSLGEITSVTTNTMENLGEVATRAVMLVSSGLLNTAWITVAIFVFDWRIGLILVTGFGLYILLNYWMNNSSKAISKAKVDNTSELVSKVLEQVQGMAEVKQFQLVGKQAKELHRLIAENVQVNTKMEYSFIPFMAVQSLWIKWIGVVLSMVSIWFYLSGSMDLAMTLLMLVASFMIYEHLDTAGNYSALLRVIENCVHQAGEILTMPRMDIDGEEIEPENHSIELKHVTFSYQDENLIQDMNLKIQEKTTTAIVGPSGSGKTTLCHLIARFWDVQEGEILLGGRNIKDYSLDSLMKNFSFVFQNVYLFNDTIANNIRFGQPDVSMDKVIEAAKSACCHEFIMALPNGYDTIIGEGGSSLSGGEKQRISIARAILKNAPIIILDEATANVDPENEKSLVQAIHELTKNKTIIMIAHRLKTVRQADRILVLDHGHVVQDGNHKSLMNEEGIYQRFIQERSQAASWKL